MYARLERKWCGGVAMEDDEKETCQKTFAFINVNVKVPHIHINTQASRH